MRESPALDVMGLLHAAGRERVATPIRTCPTLHGREWSGGYDITAVDMTRGAIAAVRLRRRSSPITRRSTTTRCSTRPTSIVDTRNAIKQPHPNVFKLGAPRAPGRGRRKGRHDRLIRTA